MKIHISLAHQQLTLFDNAGQKLNSWLVSTASNGAGEQSGSYCTPRGEHLIRAKIGSEQPENTIFLARRPSGEIYSPELGAEFPDRDWILTRILWLSGCERGFNRLGSVDTMHRYIYIHGCPDNVPMGAPASHGCIRMRNADILELFDQVPVYTPVEISED
ncbi:MAG: L,D-transpeptidase [Betaproteobacteria bacterium]